MPLAIRGVFTSNSEGNSNDTVKDRTIWFQNENNKKTSFVYDESFLCDGDGNCDVDQNEVSTAEVAATATATGSELSSVTKSCQQITMEKPCHLFLECSPHTYTNDTSSSNTTAFLFGGIEIHSNSRNIEVYALAEDSNNNKFDYLKTCRGIMIRGGKKGKEPWEKELYKTIIIPPNSKPIPILKLHLKLLTLRPAKCNTGYIKLVKVKGRLPDVTTVASSFLSSTSISQPTQSTTQQQQQTITTSSMIATTSVPQQISNNPTVTGAGAGTGEGTGTGAGAGTSELTNAISAITILIQNTKQTMEQSISSSIGEIQKLTFQQSQNFHTTLQSLEYNINNVNDNLNGLRKEVNFLIERQKKKEEEEVDSSSSNNNNQDNKESNMNDYNAENDTNTKKQTEIDQNDENKKEKIQQIEETQSNDNNNDDENNNNINNKESIQEYMEKMQREHKMEMKQLLAEERKILLREMDERRNEIMKEIKEQMMISKDNTDNSLVTPVQVPVPISVSEPESEPELDENQSIDDNKDKGIVIVPDSEPLSLPSPLSLLGNNHNNVIEEDLLQMPSIVVEEDLLQMPSIVVEEDLLQINEPNEKEAEEIVDPFQKEEPNGKEVEELD